MTIAHFGGRTAGNRLWSSSIKGSVPAGRGLGFLGAIGQLALAAGLAVFVTGATPGTPVEAIPRGVALGLLYAAPGVVGLLGTIGARRSLLVGAAIADVIGAPLSWGGLTLLFLVPGILFVAQAIRLPGLAAEPDRGALSRVGSLAIAAAIALGTAGLMVGGGVVLLATTREQCWIATPGPAGTTYRAVETIEGVALRGDQSGGCTGAAITPAGAAAAAAFELSAVAIAALAARPRREVTPRSRPRAPR